MSIPVRRISSPHARDLIGVGVYCAAILAIVAAVYAGVQAAAPDAASGMATVSNELERWTKPDPDAQSSNVQQRRAAREAAVRPHPALSKSVEYQPPGQAPGPTGVAAWAKAKALATMGGRRGKPKGDDALPANAQPAEQAGYRPPQPLSDLHRVY